MGITISFIIISRCDLVDYLRAPLFINCFVILSVLFFPFGLIWIKITERRIGVCYQDVT